MYVHDFRVARKLQMPWWRTATPMTASLGTWSRHIYVQVVLPLMLPLPMPLVLLRPS